MPDQDQPVPDEVLDLIEAAIADDDENAEGEQDQPEGEGKPENLEGEEAPEGDDQEEPEGDQEGEEEPENNIDYDQEVPMPDGREATTLGALKDRVIELERTEEQIINRENDLMKRSDELTQALQLAGGELPPELKQQMQALQHTHLQRESDAMFESIPAWKDPAVMKEDRKSLVKLGTTYGLSHKEISGIMDHRLIKLMHDHVRLLGAQQKGKDNLKRLSAVKPKKGRTKQIDSKANKLNQQVADASKSRNQDTKMDAFDALIKAG